MAIKIPVKCQENWDHMSPTSQGMLCSKCQIEVIDFTDWKTEDIVSYVQKSNTKVCGKLWATPVKTNYKSNFWNKLHVQQLRFGLMLSGLLFTKFVHAENQIRNIIYDQVKEQKDVKDSITIKGMVTDESDQPLSGVHIYQVSNKEFISTDDKGIFTFNYSNAQNFRYLRLSIRSVGYDKQEIVHDLSKNPILKVKLTEAIHEMGEVIVSYPKARPPKNVDMSKQLK
ncbi:hypothetical protein D3C86_1310960 [compost metagenome]